MEARVREGVMDGEGSVEAADDVSEPLKDRDLAQMVLCKLESPLKERGCLCLVFDPWLQVSLPLWRLQEEHGEVLLGYQKIKARRGRWEGGEEREKG